MNNHALKLFSMSKILLDCYDMWVFFEIRILISIDNKQYSQEFWSLIKLQDLFFQVFLCDINHDRYKYPHMI